MKKIAYLIFLSVVILCLSACEDDDEQLINFTLTFIRNSDDVSLFNMEYENGDNIGSDNFAKYQQSFWNLDPNQSATESFSIIANRALVLKDFSTNSGTGTITVNTGQINDGDTLSWLQGSNSVSFGGTGSACGNLTYEGPTTDAQVSAWCQNAQILQCIDDTSPEYLAQCQILQDFGVTDCPYCN